MSYEFETEVNGEPVTVTFTYDPGDPGNYCGLPENGWPSEPASLEFESVMFKGVDILPIIDGTSMADELVEKCIEYMEGCAESAAEDKAEAQYEARKEIERGW